MIALVLNILGVIAIVLLGVLLFGLALFVMVLLVPICYKCEGDINGTSFSGRTNVSWLFGFLALELDKDQNITVCVMGMRVWRSAESNAQEMPRPQPHTSKDIKQPTFGHTKPQEQKPKEHKATPKAHKREKFTDKCKEAWHTFKEFKDYPDKSEILSQATLLLKRIITATMPDSLELRGRFGFEDPGSTGLATGAICAIAPFIPSRIKFLAKPDFSQQIIELKLLVKGKISGISFVIPFCKFLFSEPVWKLARPLITKFFRRRQLHG